MVNEYNLKIENKSRWYRLALREEGPGSERESLLPEGELIPHTSWPVVYETKSV